jgi:hypothetical protein
MYSGIYICSSAYLKEVGRLKLLSCHCNMSQKSKLQTSRLQSGCAGQQPSGVGFDWAEPRCVTQ